MSSSSRRHARRRHADHAGDVEPGRPDDRPGWPSGEAGWPSGEAGWASAESGWPDGRPDWPEAYDARDDDYGLSNGHHTGSGRHRHAGGPLAEPWREYEPVDRCPVVDRFVPGGGYHPDLGHPDVGYQAVGYQDVGYQDVAYPPETYATDDRFAADDGYEQHTPDEPEPLLGRVVRLPRRRAELPEAIADCLRWGAFAIVLVPAFLIATGTSILTTAIVEVAIVALAVVVVGIVRFAKVSLPNLETPHELVPLDPEPSVPPTAGWEEPEWVDEDWDRPLADPSWRPDRRPSGPAWNHEPNGPGWPNRTGDRP